MPLVRALIECAQSFERSASHRVRELRLTPAQFGTNAMRQQLNRLRAAFESGGTS